MTSLPGPSPLALTLSLLLTTSTLGQEAKCRDCPSYQGCLPTWQSDYCVFMPDPNRPYSRNSFLVTHNAFALSSIWLPWTANQARSIATQLQDGVRGFMLDLHKHNGVIKLCHDRCEGFFFIQGGKKPATFRSALETFRDFLNEHQDQVLTLFYESYVSVAEAAKEYEPAGVAKYMYPKRRWPPKGQEWPTLKQMAPAIVVFTTDDWDYLLESMYGKVETNECSQRPESSRFDTQTRTLLLVNHFMSVGMETKNKETEFQKKLRTCHDTWGRWANFLAVDFYERGVPVTSAIRTVSWLNWQWDPQQNKSRPNTTPAPPVVPTTTVTRPVVPTTVTQPVAPTTVTRPVAPTTVTRPIGLTTVTQPVAPTTVTRPVVPTTVTQPVASTKGMAHPVAPTGDVVHSHGCHAGGARNVWVYTGLSLFVALNVFY